MQCSLMLCNLGVLWGSLRSVQAATGHLLDCTVCIALPHNRASHCRSSNSAEADCKVHTTQATASLGPGTCIKGYRVHSTHNTATTMQIQMDFDDPNYDANFEFDAPRYYDFEAMNERTPGDKWFETAPDGPGCKADKSKLQPL